VSCDVFPVKKAVVGRELLAIPDLFDDVFIPPTASCEWVNADTL
jgi:hypothetical protein